MFNNVVLVGRLTTDVSIKTLEDGKKVSEITLAVHRSFKNYNGQYEADFIKVTIWENLALSVESYCKKGTMVLVSARIQNKVYTKSDNTKVHTYEIIAERISYIDNLKQKNVNESFDQEPHLDSYEESPE
ncbi:MAG: single-stranded DNA-binding protein [Acholeplasmatales bacterium]|jgi:single-strand DNA-binding protein|nr:single-stranded DNA-binding protein [Acholeplasmatales bacterium]